MGELCFAAPENAPRMDKCLAEAFPGYSRAFFAKLLAAGAVTVDGRTASAADKPRAGAAVCCRLPEEPAADEVRAEHIPLDIVFEDDAMLVVNKPKGMVTHPAAGNFCGNTRERPVGIWLPAVVL